VSLVTEGDEMNSEVSGLRWLERIRRGRREYMAVFGHLKTDWFGSRAAALRDLAIEARRA